MRCKPLLWLFTWLFPGLGLLCWPLLSPADTGLASYSASYRLLFDGEPVGDSFFRLELTAEQGYRFEAYTLPIGKDDKTQTHEILESSTGKLNGEGTPRPQSYYFSVFNEGKTSLLEFAFDWPGKQLIVSSKEQSTTLELNATTQDRLSYLLLLGQWLASSAKETHFPIAQPGVTATAEIVRIENSTIEVDAGSFETVHLLRVDAGDDLRRELWLESAPPHRLIAMERHELNGVARMEMIAPEPSKSEK